MNPQCEPTYAELKEDIVKLRQELAMLGISEFDLQAELIELKSATQGPDGFDSWKAAALDERIKRVAAEAKVRVLEAQPQKAPSTGGSLLVNSGGTSHRVPLADLAAVPQLISLVEDLQKRVAVLEAAASWIGSI